MKHFRRDALALLLAFTGVGAAHAGQFDCSITDPLAPAHQPMFHRLAEQIGHAPAELAYCDHDTHPRWVARWDPFEEFDYDGESWRRYATARCMDRADQSSCFITKHAVAGSSHVVVDLARCDVGLRTVARIHEAAAQLYPGHELKEIEFVVVRDGGAWTAADYGYEVRFLEPPNYTGGPIRRFVEACINGNCTWRDAEEVGSWTAASSDLSALRRARNDPLIEYLSP